MGAFAIEPGRRDEACHRAADHVFHQRTPVAHARQSLGMGEVEELALAGGHVLALDRGKALGRRGLVLVAPAMEEHLDALIRPAAQACGKGRVARDGRAAPMIGDHQHGEIGRADMPRQPFGEGIDLAFEPRRNVVDRYDEPLFRQPPRGNSRRRRGSSHPRAGITTCCAAASRTRTALTIVFMAVALLRVVSDRPLAVPCARQLRRGHGSRAIKPQARGCRPQIGQFPAHFIARRLSIKNVELKSDASGRAPSRPAILLSEMYYGP